MICDNCRKENARVRKVSRAYGNGKNLFVIEDVPVVSCSNCGESYVTAETLHELERLKLHRKNFVVKKTMNVMQYA